MSAGSTGAPDGRVPATDQAPAPETLPRGVVVLLGTGAAVVTAAGVRSFAEIVGPVFLALVLTIAVSPLRRSLIRRGVKRWLAGLIALVVVNAFLLGVAAMLAYSVAELAGLLPTYQDKFAELVADTRAWLADRGVGQDQLQAALQLRRCRGQCGIVMLYLPLKRASLPPALRGTPVICHERAQSRAPGKGAPAARFALRR